MAFYYSEFSDIGTNDNGAFRRFCLYKRDSTQSEPIDLLSGASGYEYLDSDNVWDFYIAENGSIYFRSIAVGLVGRKQPSIDGDADR
jgi:hypothetical protein